MTTRLRNVSLREIYKCPVIDGDGTEIGLIDDVLFHPFEPRAIGYSVRPTVGWESLFVSHRYLALDTTSVTDDGMIKVVLDKQAWGKKAEKQLGYSWDESVIWYGQHVHTIGGQHLGRISDALFSLESGRLAAIEITDGTISDVSLGKRTVVADEVLKFDLEDVHGIIVADEAASAPYAGGLALLAGRGVARAKETAKEATKSTIVAAGHAVGHIERFIKLNLSADLDDEDDDISDSVATQSAKQPTEDRTIARRAGGWLGSVIKGVSDEYKKGLEEE